MFAFLLAAICTYKGYTHRWRQGVGRSVVSHRGADDGRDVVIADWFTSFLSEAVFADISRGGSMRTLADFLDFFLQILAATFTPPYRVSEPSGRRNSWLGKARPSFLLGLFRRDGNDYGIVVPHEAGHP